MDESNNFLLLYGEMDEAAREHQLTHENNTGYSDGTSVASYGIPARQVHSWYLIHYDQSAGASPPRKCRTIFLVLSADL